MKMKTILLVEDNPNDVVLTLRAFKKNNIENKIVVAGDGLEALDYLFRTGKYKDRDTKSMPALILLDLKLPKMDGLKVLECIRADDRTKLLPVVILTSSNEEQDIIRSYNLHANSYIRKLVDFNKFVEAGQNLQSYWLVLNEQPPLRS
jgi:two-component system, response regulator